MANVLVVEDDQFVRSALIRELSRRSHTVRSASTALDALRDVAQSAPDLVILDLGLPDIDGTDALRMMRAVSDVPVIVATARRYESDIISLLNAGADDYVTKPFSGGHILARIAAVLRRARTARNRPRRSWSAGWGPPRQRRAVLDGRRCDLTRREFDLLAYLAERAGQVISRRELLNEVWSQARTARTRPSTYTCRGCAGSSGRRRPSPASCTPCVVSA